MWAYILSKLSYGILTLFGVVSLIFALFHVIPGDPVRMMLGQQTDEASIEMVTRDIGMHLPLGQQYVKYLNDLSPLSMHQNTDPDHYLFLDPEKYSLLSEIQFGNWSMAIKKPYFRRSYQSQKRVTQILAEALPATLLLTTTAILIAFILGSLLGILGAVFRDSWLDRSLLVVATIGMSGPSFFIAIIVSWVFGFILTNYTGLEMSGSMFEVDDLGRGEYFAPKNLILPAITLGIRPLSVVMQLMRNSLLQVMGEDYIRTARAKGLSEIQVVYRHALRNSLNPVITAISGWFAGMLAGAVFVEMIFAWKGIGWEIVNALQKYDLPVVMGAVIVISSLFVLINILVDVSYTILDPRVKLQN